MRARVYVYACVYTLETDSLGDVARRFVVLAVLYVVSAYRVMRVI